MIKNILYIFVSIALLGCEHADNNETPNKQPSADGDHITSISMTLDRSAQTRVGVDIDPSQTKDIYYWTKDDVIVLCELDETATTFTGNNYSYTLKSIPSTHGETADFEGINAVTTRSYVVLHTRNWSNVVLPAASGSITLNVPELIQRNAITAANADAAQDFADNLFFSTTTLTGEQLLADGATLHHQLVQVEVDLTGQPADNGKRIRRIELLPETVGGYAESITIDATGAATPVGSTNPSTFITDPNAKLGTPYKVRVLTRPTSLDANNGVSVRVHCGMAFCAPSTIASAKVFEPGKVYTLQKQIGAVDKPVTTTSMATTPYIGAFWKKDQIGERLIRIITSDANDIGKWTATVAWTDENWPEDEIIIYETPSPSENEYRRLYNAAATDTPIVSNLSAMAKGTSSYKSSYSYKPIFFKIGLKSKYSPTPDAPARYAVILISYKDNTKNHFIYLRQGEDPDIIGQGTTTKWAVYNVGNFANPTQYENGGFVRFPTQAGYFKKWTNKDLMYQPTIPTTGTVTGWKNDRTYATISNVAPLGYRIPTSLTASTGDYASLFVGTNVEARTHIFGYYADGFFDRNPMQAKAVGENSLANSSVQSVNDNVGYNGCLVVNTTSYASLFFPSPGYRMGSSTGKLFYAGDEGEYWSSTPMSSFSFSKNLLPSRKTSSGNSTYGTDGASIRCVQN